MPSNRYISSRFIFGQRKINNKWDSNELLSYSFTRILLSINILGQQQHCKKTSKWATTYMYYVGLLFMLPLKEKNDIMYLFTFFLLCRTILAYACFFWGGGDLEVNLNQNFFHTICSSYFTPYQSLIKNIISFRIF
jgi:hypothetical protein